MPASLNRTPRRGKSSPASTVNVSTTGVIEPETADPIERAAQLEGMSFFDALRAMSPQEWEGCIVYVYRLEPKVKNATEPAYIEKLTHAVDEEYIKDNHGGGVYQLRLKWPVGEDRLHKVTIQGTPKFQLGQTFREEAAPAATAAGTVLPPAAGNSEQLVANIVSQVLKVMQEKNIGRDDALREVVSTMKAANEASMEIMTSSLKQQAGSTTGSSLTDKLLEAALANFMKPAPSLADQLKEAAAFLKILRPDTPEVESPRGGSLERLAEIKELFGVDDIRDLVKGNSKSGPDWISGLFGFGEKLLTNIPTILQQISEMQAQNFERAITVAQLRGSGVLPAATAPPRAVPRRGPSGPVPTATQSSTAGVASPAIPTRPVHSAAAGPHPSEEHPGGSTVLGVTQILETVVMQFNAGTPGDGTADILFQLLPAEVLTVVKPYFSDIAAIKTFVANQAVFSEIKDDPEFPEFLEEFVKRVQENFAQPAEPADGAQGT